MNDLSNLERRDLLEMGFYTLDYKTITNPLMFNLGRGRELNISGLGTGNEMMWLCAREDEEGYSDLVCLHNSDYNGRLTKEAVEGIIRWFSKYSVR